MRFFTIAYNPYGLQLKTRYLEAKGFRQAFESVKKETYFGFHHALVINEKKRARRYTYTGKLLKPDMRPFKTFVNSKHAILVFSRQATEFVRFDTEQERDEAYEKACTIYARAVSAASDKEPSGITACSEGTSGSKSGSTSKKTWSGFANDATWMDSLIHFSTAEISGSVNVKSTDDYTWSIGSTISRSKQKPIFATVKICRDMGATTALQGKTIQVVKEGKYIWRDAHTGWLLMERWLNFRQATLKVVKPKRRDDWLPALEGMEGQVMLMTKCSDHWNNGVHCLGLQYLTLPDDDEFLYTSSPVVSGMYTASTFIGKTT